MISNCASSTMINQFEMRKVTHVSDQVLELPDVDLVMIVGLDLAGTINTVISD